MDKMTDIDYLTSDICRDDASRELNEAIGNFSIPNNLYQYRPFSKWSVDNIINNRISLSNPNNFNDTYDSYLHDESLEPIVREIEDLNLALQDFTFEITKDFIDNRNRLDDFRARKMRENFRITCFSTKEDDSKMWGLYAKDNSGICTEYNFNEASNNLQKLLFPVLYKTEPINTAKLCSADKIIQAMLLSIIVKAKCWEYESEWRLILPLPHNLDIEFLPISKVPNPSKIIIGTNYSYKNLTKENKLLAKQLKSYMNNNAVPLYRCLQKRHQYQLEITQACIEELEV